MDDPKADGVARTAWRRQAVRSDATPLVGRQAALVRLLLSSLQSRALAEGNSVEAIPFEGAFVSTGIWSAASGMVSQSNAVDLASENVANANTIGYRADRQVFVQVLAEAAGADPGSQSMRYSAARSVEPDFQVGEIRQTGGPLDVALMDDSSFFKVQTAEGDRYTRAGNFRLSSEGRLTLPDGATVLGSDNRPIDLPTNVSVSFDDTGNVMLDGERSGQKLWIGSFPNVEGLIKEGGALLRARPESGRAFQAEATLRVGALELSNSDAMKSMSGLVTATRQFEMLARVIDAFSDAERRAATDIAKR